MPGTTTPALNLRSVEREAEGEAERVEFATDRGVVIGRLHTSDGDAAVLWVFGAGGGLNGPAGGLYPRLGSRFRKRGVASLEVAYRKPGRLEECVADALLGISWLTQQGKDRIVLVGHSFGGAVVITAGVAAVDVVVGVVALSSQTSGTRAVAALSPL